MPTPGPCDEAGLGMDATVVSLDAHKAQTGALLSPCGVLCWGNNRDAQAGVANVILVPVPMWVANISFTCAPSY